MEPRKERAVLISDVHFNIQNMELATQVITKALATAMDLDVPLIIAGDLHDTKAMMRGECVNRMLELFTSRPVAYVPIYILVGNHDRINEKSQEHSLSFLDSQVYVVDEPRYEPELDMYLIPYQHDLEALKCFLATIPEGATVIAHQGVQGADMGHYVVDHTSLPLSCWSGFRTISGHYHKRQDLYCPGGGLFSYLGSPYSQSFGEADHGVKGFSILGTDGSLTLVDTNLPRHVIVEEDACNLQEWVSSNLDYPRVYTTDHLWLKVAGTRAELAKVNKGEIGNSLLGHANYKLDKIPLDRETLKPIVKKLTNYEILDKIIDTVPKAGVHEIKRLKDLARRLTT